MQTKREFFTNGQLMLIASSAAVCAEPFDGVPTTSDELAVYEMISQYAEGFSAEQLAVFEFCARQCERQKSGALSVYRMVDAWNHAIECQHAGNSLNTNLVDKLVEMAEPNLSLREDAYKRIDTIIHNWLMGTLDAPQLPTEPDERSSN